MAELLRVSDLQTHYVSFGGNRIVKAVDGVSFTLEDGETLGIVGESGCGKTTTCLSIVGLLPAGAEIVGGRIEVAEPAYYHKALRGRSLRQRVRELLNAVRIPSPAMRMREYPHQMSGGMRQRIVGAIALAGGPKLIIADEPTTNLDVTIQAQYLDLLKDLQEATGVAIIFVTHNLGIVARMCDRLAVMYAGKIVEQAPVRELFDRPKHPYTRALLGSVPKLGNKDPLYAIPGQPPNLANLPGGCSFHPRCPEAVSRCMTEEPRDVHDGDGSVARCWLLDDALTRP